MKILSTRFFFTQETAAAVMLVYSVFFFFRKAANKLADATDTGGVFLLVLFGDGVDLEFSFFKL